MKHPIPDAALDDRLSFIGTSGSGKTYNSGTAVERLLARKARVVIIDPLGVWWGLRLLADGKTPSPHNVVIFGGPHGDLPLTDLVGALLGETAATMAESCIIDLSQLGSKAAERRFMLAFLDAIYRKASGEPFHLVVDEADLFAPQKPQSGDEALLGLMENIVRRGRVKGFIPWLISQRPAVLNKNVLSQTDGLLAFKLTATHDRDALDDWIEGQADKVQGREIKAALPTMQLGTGVVWLPSRGILETAKFPAKITFDSSATPKRGEKVKRTANLKPLDVGSLKEKLASVEAETKANDPKALKAEVADLRRQLAKADKGAIQAAKTDPAAIEKARTDGFTKGRDAGYSEGVLVGYHRSSSILDDAKEKLARSIKSIEMTPEKPGKTLPKGAGNAQFIPDFFTMVGPGAKQSSSHSQPAKAAPRAAAVPADGLSGPAQRILDALAELEAIGANAPPRIMVANLAGYGHPQSTGFVKALSTLRTDALVDYGRGDGTVFLTDAGRAAAAPSGVPLSDADLHQRIKTHLSGPGCKIFDAVVAAYPNAMSRDDLARAADYGHVQSTGFVKALSKLRTFGFIDYRPGAQVVALPILFIE